MDVVCMDKGFLDVPLEGKLVSENVHVRFTVQHSTIIPNTRIAKI